MFDWKFMLPFISSVWWGIVKCFNTYCSKNLVVAIWKVVIQTTACMTAAILRVVIHATAIVTDERDQESLQMVAGSGSRPSGSAGHSRGAGGSNPRGGNASGRGNGGGCKGTKRPGEGLESSQTKK